MTKVVGSWLFFVLLLFTSCTVQKRQHLSGFYFEWFKSKPAVQSKRVASTSHFVVSSTKNLNSVPSKRPVVKSVSQPSVVYEVVRDVSEAWHQSTVKLANAKATVKPCDTIFRKDGTVMQVKDLKIEGHAITYRLCGTYGPRSLIYLQDVSQIKQRFGKRTVVVYDAEKKYKRRTPEPIAALSFLAAIGTLIPLLAFEELLGLVFVGPVIFALGFIGYRRIVRDPFRWSGKGLALTGITVGSILSAVTFLAVFLYVLEELLMTLFG